MYTTGSVCESRRTCASEVRCMRFWRRWKLGTPPSKETTSPSRIASWVPSARPSSRSSG